MISCKIRTIFYNKKRIVVDNKWLVAKFDNIAYSDSKWLDGKWYDDVICISKYNISLNHLTEQATYNFI